MDFAKIVNERLEQLGENINSFEAKQGWSQGYLRAVVRDDAKRTVPNIERAKTICRALGLDFYIGPPRPRPSAIGFAEAAQAQLETTLDGSPEALTKGYLPLPFHRADLAHKDLSHVAFARAHLEGEHLDPDQLSAVVMPNDDMYPAIRTGDILMIDERFRPEVEPTLCAFTFGSELRVGWLTVPKGGCMVGFFMRSYTPPAVSKGGGGLVIECLGRVIARVHDNPEPWIDAGEKSRLVALAKDLVSRR